MNRRPLDPQSPPGGPSGSIGVLGVGSSSARGGGGVEGIGTGNGTGVTGSGSGSGGGVTGIGGTSNGPGVTGAGRGSGDGVIGTSPTGNGVHGLALSPSGAGVLAENFNGGAALAVSGPASFSHSGIAAIPRGQSEATVSGFALTSQSFVLATIQGNLPGIYLQGVTVVPGLQKFTIHLNKAVPSPTNVAWLIVN